MGASAILSEIVFQGLGLFYMGRTVNFARSSGYYRLGAIAGIVIPWGKAAYIMYAGALLWMTVIGFVILNVLLTFFGLGELLKLLFRYVFGRLNNFSGPAKVVVNRVGEGVSGRWKAITTSMKESFRRGMLQHFARTLPPVEEIVRMVEVHKRAVEVPEQAQHQRAPLQIDEGVQMQSETFNVATQQLTEGSEEDQSYAWLYKMGLSLEALDKFFTVFIWMVLPFVGQWLFWVGFVDLAGDL
ncbi:Fc.00g031810.m01.CDS01 [Cosmosporella sp. VM-42]